MHVLFTVECDEFQAENKQPDHKKNGSNHNQWIHAEKYKGFP